MSVLPALIVASLHERRHLMQSYTGPNEPRAPMGQLAEMLLGGVITHGTLSATYFIAIAEEYNLNTDAQAAAVAELLDLGVIAVHRTDDIGAFCSVPGVSRLPAIQRQSAVAAFAVAGMVADYA